MRLIVIIVCFSMSMAKSVSPSAKIEKVEIEARNQIQNFLDEYEHLVKDNIHERFRTNFLAFGPSFDIIVILSTTNESLVYIEKNEPSRQVSFNYTQINPFRRLHELKHPIEFATTTLSDRGFRFAGDYNKGTALIAGVTIETSDGVPGRVEIGSSGLFLNIVITIKNNGTTVLETRLPGITFLFGSSSMSEDFDLKKLAERLFSSEARQLYSKSEAFRKALVHPRLKEIAERIASKMSAADNKGKEYPYWELQEDIEEMRQIARENYIDVKYVDEVFNSKQYKPIDGHLLFYFSTAKSFMMQWLLINAIFLCVVYALSHLTFWGSSKLYLIIIAIILAVNGWVFNKKPDEINLIYWLIPFLTGFAAILLSAFDQIVKTIGIKP